MAEKIPPDRLTDAKVFQLGAKPMPNGMKGYSIRHCQSVLNSCLLTGAGATFFTSLICPSVLLLGKTNRLTVASFS